LTKAMENRIKNFDQLAITENRRLALSVAEAGLAALDTEKVILDSVQLVDNNLSVLGKNFDLSKFKNIKMVGFGKAACAAAVALEKVLGSRITEGAVIGLQKADSQYIETFVGTHPRPSRVNVEAGEKIYAIVKNSEADDLIIAVVSGGGSALLCSSDSECAEGTRLYDSFLKTGKTITELNTVRKHISIFKGGGLAKIAYPATLLGLIFSDVPGDNFGNVASGPTYQDATTIEDARRIIRENNLGEFNLIETPKEERYFEKTHNFVLVSNKNAVAAMEICATELGLKVKVVSTEIYEEMTMALEKIFLAEENDAVALAAGEPSVKVGKRTGRGGRNLHLGLMALAREKVGPGSVFITLASDGLDNSDAAGALIDDQVKELAKKLQLDAQQYLDRFDSYTFLKATGGMIITGPTGANVSDLMILLTKNNG